MHNGFRTVFECVGIITDAVSQPLLIVFDCRYAIGFFPMILVAISVTILPPGIGFSGSSGIAV
ncbi:hypothetical protein, partial [Neisseria iguanae]|uniref:hypothetical protein n=1 Tax=Neisseria iguanae TaxID=90242 RepID=UPI001B7FF926